MKILIFGAGVIGSIYAARLHEANHEVTLLARGRRYEELCQDGVIITEKITGKQLTSPIPVVQELTATDFYDLIIVTVRFDQVDSIIPILQQNKNCLLVLFLLNNPGNATDLMSALYPKHILLGLPGAGGIKNGKSIDYIQIKQQKTTIGEISGPATDQLRAVKTVLENAGFGVGTGSNMPAWLKTHAVFVSCVTAAILSENGDPVQLSHKRGSVRLMVSSIREGFLACRALGMPVKPTNLKIIFMIMPRWFSVLYWQGALRGKVGTLAMAPHANAAKAEMGLLAGKVIAMLHSSPLPTPTLDKLLYSFIQATKFY